MTRGGSLRWYAAGMSALCVVVATCSPRGGRLAPLWHLADEDARQRGASEPTTVQIGATTRYVLGPGPGRWKIRGGTTDERGRQRFDIRCEPHLAGRQAMVEVRTLLGTHGEHEETRTLALRRRCPADPASPLTLDVAGGLPGKSVRYLVRIGGLPAPVATTAPLELPPQGELRLNVGVVGESGERPLRITVRAVGPSGARVVLFRAVVAPDNQWHELRVPLARAREDLGREVRLEFKRKASCDEKQVAYIALGNPIVWGRSEQPVARAGRNVVLISLDTLRADRLGVYGYPVAVSPVLDGVAREGTLFEHAIAQASWTIPSHATMFTGAYSCVHGLGIDEYDRGPEDENRAGPLLGRPLPLGVRPIAEILRDAGFSTAAFTENAFVDPGSFQRGFDEFSADKRVGWAAGVVEETVHSAVDWLRAHAEERFFLFVHTYQVHAPYAPPLAYDHIAALRPLPVAPGGLRPTPVAEADAAKYVAEVAYTDTSLAPLFQALDQLGIADQTIVVVTSDHGEAFGEQGEMGHSTGISEEQLHVPLIWRAPGLIAPGRRVSTMVGVVDIAPTLLALLGLDVPPWIQGHSLAPMLGVEAAPAGSEPRLLPAEGYTIQGVRGKDWKVTRRGSELSVVAVSGAGVESPVPRPAPSQTEAAFATVARECERARGVLGKAGLKRPVGTNVGADAERERKLRALGYLD